MIYRGLFYVCTTDIYSEAHPIAHSCQKAAEFLKETGSGEEVIF